jgi:precorrin-2/cobalt-factor-2 C20-methyltransferase
VIAYLAANGGDSTARSIVAPFMPDDVEEIMIDMPMRMEREPGQAVYDAGAARIAEHLSKGEDVVMLCEGDPFFYGSFMYVFERLSGRFSTVVVPGVTSISAAAAAMGQPLSARDDMLKILPATMAEQDLQRELATADAAAIIKVGRHFGKVKRVLAALNLVDAATAITRATQPDEMITPVAAITTETLPYFTTLIVRRSRHA